MSADRQVPAAAVFELALAVDRLPADLRLRSLEWGVFFAVTGRHTVAQIGEHLCLRPADRDEAFARLVELGLLAERPLSAGEYLRAASTVNGEPRTLSGFLTAGLAGPPFQPVASAAPDVSVLEPISDFEPLPLPEQEIVMTPDLPIPTIPTIHTLPPPLSLQAVMRFVVDQAPDANAGQLDVYRAFVRLDPQLLKRNGITTLRFEEDRLLTDPDLKSALLKSVEQVVGRSCPPEVFVAAR
ncbi:MAG: hypothetical protein ABJC13_08170 [Acidobacteriota bacterium]